MYIKENPNPHGARVGDCVIRAISIATGEDWDKVYVDLCVQGFLMKDMPSSNHVWGSYLQSKGFEKYTIPYSCPDCYTIKDFSNDAPHGTYVVGTGSHAVCVIVDKNGGNYFDVWDSGDENPVFCFRKEW